MISTDNKNSYFKVVFEFDIKNPNINPEIKKLELKDKIDIVLTKLNVTDNYFEITDENNQNKLEILFETLNRKRLGVIKNTIIKTIDVKITDAYYPPLFSKERVLSLKAENDAKPILKECMAYTKFQFYERINNTTNTNRYDVVTDAIKYEGNDIELFNDRKNYHPWQLKLERLLFEKDGSFKKADTRKIVFILDEEGCSGKSTYWKHLLIKHNLELGLLAEANMSQIKSALNRMGAKKLYIVDLPRTKSKMGVNDLINVLEQVKSGIVINNMYGQNNTLLIPPCHIIVSGNYLPYGSLSPDRWKVFKITKEGSIIDWVDISEEKQNEALMSIEKSRAKEFIRVNKENDYIIKNLDSKSLYGKNFYSKDLSKFFELRDSLKKQKTS